MTGFFSLFSFYSTNEYIKNRLRLRMDDKGNREGDDGLLIFFSSSQLELISYFNLFTTTTMMIEQLLTPYTITVTNGNLIAAKAAAGIGA